MLPQFSGQAAATGSLFLFNVGTYLPYILELHAACSCCLPWMDW